ncbi:lipase family protein [Nocardia brasiliensis]|uniref:lipase family protein n=1 Tax=Nocardia brasiliensis TaxID=37326 RepID=UPI0018945E1D|nr:lipase [Nocardia brasiliensis]
MGRRFFRPDGGRKFRPIRAILGALTIGVAMAATGTVTASAQPIWPLPDPDPFYAVPADIASKAPGDVLDSRPMPPLFFFPGATVTLIKFRSTNSQGEPIAATTTVLTPLGHRADAPLLSFQHIINGLGTQCAISHGLYANDTNFIVPFAPVLNVALARGWSVALPDHLGPNSAYGAAKLGGRITLDGIRAAQRLPQLGLGQSPAAVAGYSGGGMATAWAAALAPTYAPELNLVGAAEGGVPMNLTTMGWAIGHNQHPAFGLGFAAVLGLEREYPDRLPITSALNERGLAAARGMANSCTNDLIARGVGHSFDDYAKDIVLAHDPKAWAVADENSVELYDGVPRAPVFEWHSPQDGLIPLDAITNTVHRYCRAGVKVQAELYPTPDHLTAAELGLPSMMNWLDGRFAGKPAPSNCA